MQTPSEGSGAANCFFIVTTLLFGIYNNNFRYGYRSFRTARRINLAAYVGDGRVGNDGSEEAVTTVASVLSATLLGVPPVNIFLSRHISSVVLCAAPATCGRSNQSNYQ